MLIETIEYVAGRHKKGKKSLGNWYLSCPKISSMCWMEIQLGTFARDNSLPTTRHNGIRSFSEEEFSFFMHNFGFFMFLCKRIRTMFFDKTLVYFTKEIWKYQASNLRSDTCYNKHFVKKKGTWGYEILLQKGFNSNIGCPGFSIFYLRPNISSIHITMYSHIAWHIEATMKLLWYTYSCAHSVF